jgi:hypothetical protein
MKNGLYDFGADGLVQGQPVACGGALLVGANYRHVMAGKSQGVG